MANQWILLVLWYGHLSCTVIKMFNFAEELALLFLIWGGYRNVVFCISISALCFGEGKVQLLMYYCEIE